MAVAAGRPSSRTAAVSPDPWCSGAPPGDERWAAARPAWWHCGCGCRPCLLAFAVVYGTVGYILIEGFGPLDAVYMTVTTLVTVGYGEIHPLGPGGRVFTLTLITIGVGAVFILIGAFTTALASGELGLFLKRRSMRSRLDALEGTTSSAPTGGWDGPPPRS